MKEANVQRKSGWCKLQQRVLFGKASIPAVDNDLKKLVRTT